MCGFVADPYTILLRLLPYKCESYQIPKDMLGKVNFRLVGYELNAQKFSIYNYKVQELADWCWFSIEQPQKECQS